MHFGERHNQEKKRKLTRGGKLRRGCRKLSDVPDYVVRAALSAMTQREQGLFAQLSTLDRQHLFYRGMNAGPVFALPEREMLTPEFCVWCATRHVEQGRLLSGDFGIVEDMVDWEWKQGSYAFVEPGPEAGDRVTHLKCRSSDAQVELSVGRPILAGQIGTDWFLEDNYHDKNTLLVHPATGYPQAVYKLFDASEGLWLFAK